MGKALHELQKGFFFLTTGVVLVFFLIQNWNIGHYLIISCSTEYLIVLIAMFTKQYAFQTVIRLTAV